MNTHGYLVTSSGRRVPLSEDGIYRIGGIRCHYNAGAMEFVALDHPRVYYVDPFDSKVNVCNIDSAARRTYIGQLPFDTIEYLGSHFDQDRDWKGFVCRPTDALGPVEDGAEEMALAAQDAELDAALLALEAAEPDLEVWGEAVELAAVIDGGPVEVGPEDWELYHSGSSDGDSQGDDGRYSIPF